MDLVLLVGLGVTAALAVGGLARRAVLGERMNRAFEAPKERSRQNALRETVERRRNQIQSGLDQGGGPWPKSDLEHPEVTC